MLRTVCAFIVCLGIIKGESIDGNLRILTRSLEKCSKAEELGTCLRIKAVTLLDKALFSKSPVVINDFLTLSADSDSLDNSTALTENDLMADLPTDPSLKDETLDGLIADRMSKYIQSRSIQFTIPADLNEGRKKKNKGGMMMMAGMAMAGMLVQMAMGKIALLAGKALLVGKMALLLSAIIGLKKLVGSGGGGESHPQVVYATESHGGGGGGWGRSFEKRNEEQEQAQELAYSYQAQARSNQ